MSILSIFSSKNTINTKNRKLQKKTIVEHFCPVVAWELKKQNQAGNDFKMSFALII